MKYGQIAGNMSVNAAIYRCFEYISKEDARAFLRRFREQPHDQDQVMHTFRELLLGGYLASNGLRIRYDQTVCGKTPDWSVLDENGLLYCIVELVNFHVDKATEDEIKQHWRAKATRCGPIGAQSDRLYARIREKASGYKGLVERARVAYVIALFGEFTADVDEEEVRQCLYDEEGGLFSLYPEVSGVVFFLESSGLYSFEYMANPKAVRRMALSCGVLSL